MNTPILLGSLGVVAGTVSCQTVSVSGIILTDFLVITLSQDGHVPNPAQSHDRQVP